MRELLQVPQISDAANRRGLRAKTGELLEEAFLKLVLQLEPELSVEIGAHEASYSTKLKSLCPKMKVLAFEANPFVFEKYKPHPNIVTSAIEYKNLAICGESGPIDLLIPRTWPKGEFPRTNAISSILPRNSDQLEYETVNVPGQTLDDALTGIPYRTAAAWVDVEGAQKEIIQGADAFLSRASAIYIEVETAEIWGGQQTAEIVAAVLGDRGYRPVMQDNLARAQFNAVFVREEDDILVHAENVLEDYVNGLKQLLVGKIES